MIKFDGKIDLLVGEDGLHIAIYDDTSGITVFEGKVDPIVFCKALGRLSHAPMKEAILFNHNNIGKKLMVDDLIFEMPTDDYDTRKTVAFKTAKEMCPEGWEVKNYFGSQNSFFHKDGKLHARATIIKYVEVKKNDH